MNGRIALISAIALAVTAIFMTLTQPAFAQSNTNTNLGINFNTGSNNCGSAAAFGGSASTSCTISQTNHQGACQQAIRASSIFGSAFATGVLSGNDCS